MQEWKIATVENNPSVKIIQPTLSETGLLGSVQNEPKINNPTLNTTRPCTPTLNVTRPCISTVNSTRSCIPIANATRSCKPTVNTRNDPNRLNAPQMNAWKQGTSKSKRQDSPMDTMRPDTSDRFRNVRATRE